MSRDFVYDIWYIEGGVIKWRKEERQKENCGKKLRSRENERKKCRQEKGMKKEGLKKK
jgi:hypothetical protein